MATATPRGFQQRDIQLVQETSYMCDAIRANGKVPPQIFIQRQVLVLDEVPSAHQGTAVLSEKAGRQAGRREQGPRASTPAHQPLSMGKTTSYPKPETRWGQVFHASKINRLENRCARSNLIIWRLSRTSPNSFKKFPCNTGIAKLPRQIWSVLK